MSISVDWEYRINANDEIEITGYKTRDAAGELIIPSTINGRTVCSIGRAAFRRYSSITSIDIPDTVKSIKDSAFADCSSLNSVKIPYSVKVVGKPII